MGPNIDQFVEELVRIGNTDGFITGSPDRRFNADLRHIRAIEIGEKIHKMGRLDLMVKAFKMVSERTGEQNSSGLRFAWQGIGGQWDPYFVTTLL